MPVLGERRHAPSNRAPATFSVWRGQRTRWLKGWIQTYVVHMRRPWQLARELGPRADGELAVDARQMVLDRLRAEEERRGDLAVRQALGDELGDAPLLRGERLGGVARALGRLPRAGETQLVARAGLPRLGPEPLEDLEQVAFKATCRMTHR